MASRVLAVLGGEDFRIPVLRFWLTWADRIYAADSGADRCLECGFRPDLVVGDMDSMRSSVSGLDVREDDDEDRSDADKLFDALRDDGVAEFTLIGFEGDRLDHVLASLSSAVAADVAVRIILRRGFGFLGQATTNFGTHSGQRLSVMPLPAGNVSLSGVRWPLDRADMRLGEFVSLSNRATGSIRFEVHSGSAILFVESDPEGELKTW